MKKSMLIAFLILAGSIFVSHDAFSAWTQAKGHSYNQLTLSYFNTTEKFSTLGFDSEGNITRLSTAVHRIDQEEFTSTKLSYYGEFGITNQFTFIASGGYDWVRSNDNLRFAEESGPNGVGDIIVGFRQKISDNLGAGVLSSVQLDIKIPEAYEYENPATHQSLGDGQYDVTLKLLFGRGFSKGYTVVSAGYKYRFENDQLDPATFRPSDQVVISLNGGYNATSWLSIRAKLDWNKSVGNADVSEDMQKLFFPVGGKDEFDDVVIIKDSLGLEQDLLSAGASLAFSITPKIQSVLSYNRDLDGFGEFESKDASLGETFSIAMVYMY